MFSGRPSEYVGLNSYETEGRMLVQADAGIDRADATLTLGGITPLGSLPAEAALKSAHMSASARTPTATAKNTRSRIEQP
jgi:hypothetical protein